MEVSKIWNRWWLLHFAMAALVGWLTPAFNNNIVGQFAIQMLWLATWAPALHGSLGAALEITLDKASEVRIRKEVVAHILLLTFISLCFVAAFQAARQAFIPGTH